MENKVIGFKGFDKDLKCRDKQYEVGQTFEEPEADLCNKGLHFCEAPGHVFSYYRAGESRFCEVEADEVSIQKEDDSKRVAKKITIKGEVSAKRICEIAVKGFFEWIKFDDNIKKAKESPGNNAGDYGAANAGNGGAANAGYKGAAIVRTGGTASVGNNGVAICMDGGKAKGGLGSILVLVERDNNYDIISYKARNVDGKHIKPDTWYTMKDGKFVITE